MEKKSRLGFFGLIPPEFFPLLSSVCSPISTCGGTIGQGTTGVGIKKPQAGERIQPI